MKHFPYVARLVTILTAAFLFRGDRLSFIAMMLALIALDTVDIAARWR